MGIEILRVHRLVEMVIPATRPLSICLIHICEEHCHQFARMTNPHLYTVSQPLIIIRR